MKDGLRSGSDRAGGVAEGSVAEEHSAGTGMGRFGTRDREGHDRIGARVQSLLEVRQGEVGMIRIPSGGLERVFSVLPPVVGGEDRSAAAVAGLFTPDQMRVWLEEVMRSGVDLEAKVGEAEGASFSGEKLEVEIAEVVSKEQILDVSLRLQEGGRTVTSGLSVFRGQVLLLRSGYPDPEGILVVTASGGD